MPDVNNGFGLTKVPTPCRRTITFSSSNSRSASLSVARLTPSDFDNSNSEGNFSFSLKRQPRCQILNDRLLEDRDDDDLL